MLKVLLVDDEAFIAQGLEALIDWNAEGYEIAAIASNGQEALDYLKAHRVDLVIADVMMPVMTGLELLETVHREHLSDAGFVILSGYGEFSFAQQALRFGCIDYLLKPVEQSDLLAILRKFSQMSENAKLGQKYEQAYLARSVLSLLYGESDTAALGYIREHMRLSPGIRYIEIEISGPEEDDSGLRSLQQELQGVCRKLFPEHSGHYVFDISQSSAFYGGGIIYCDSMAEKRKCTETQFIQQLHRSLGISLQRDVRLLVGEKVPEIGLLFRSYQTVTALKTLAAFRGQKAVCYYEDEMQVPPGRAGLCKEHIGALLRAIERDDPERIRAATAELFREMQQRNMPKNGINLNINYLLFQLVDLASQLDDGADQDEILRLIGAQSFEDGILRGECGHLTRFACEYAQYLSQLREKVPGGVLRDIEKEVREHYAENLTLQDLGRKYFINSSYLGQIFRKQYGQSFKNYLTSYRINEACRQLLYTDKKIGQIAEDVGYRDIDYFISRFIEQKGCTPSRFRKNKG